MLVWLQRRKIGVKFDIQRVGDYNIYCVTEVNNGLCDSNIKVGRRKNTVAF